MTQGDRRTLPSAVLICTSFYGAECEPKYFSNVAEALKWRAVEQRGAVTARSSYDREALSVL